MPPTPRTTASSPGQQDEIKKTEDRGQEDKKISTKNVPANEAQRTSPTSRSATAPTEEPAIKIKIMNILDRLTKRRQDAKIDKLIDYLFGDKVTDPDITGEIKSSDIDTNGEKNLKSPIIENHENKSREINYKAFVQLRLQRTSTPTPQLMPHMPTTRPPRLEMPGSARDATSPGAHTDESIHSLPTPTQELAATGCLQRPLPRPPLRAMRQHANGHSRANTT